MPSTTERAIVAALANFDISVTVDSVTHGAAVDRYALKLGPGVKVKQVTALADDLAVALEAPHVRILTTGGTLAVEVPAAERSTVALSDLEPEQDHPLRIPVGLSVDGKGVSARLDRLPHLLVAGTTGSGKSTWTTAILAHLVTHAAPADLQLALIDPKRVELSQFAGLPHLWRPIATDVGAATLLLEEALSEMEARYGQIERAGKRNVSELDERPPFLVIVVDELADLIMQGGKRTEGAIVRLLQVGRAAGVHLVLATQRPSTDVITGLIKANTPSRMVFSVTSHTDSNVALGQSGAEALLGAGDGLWWPSGASQPERVQAPYLSGSDLDALLDPMRRTSETTEERDERVRESMFAALRAPEVPATAPTPEPTPEPATAALLPEPARELFDPDLDRALEAAYRKGRDHGQILAYSPPISHRVMIPSDWWWAAALFLVGSLAGAVALPALPLAAGVWLAYVVTRRRTSMDKYTAYSLERARMAA